VGTRLLIILAALGACERTSQKYCGLHPMDYDHCGIPDGALLQCTGNSDCPSMDLPRCNTSLGLCVACLADDDCKSPKPRCDLNTNTCVACTSGADCTSGTCLFGGTCQTPDNTAYVDSTSPGDNSDCSLAMPCLTVAAGIAVGKPFVHLHGAFAEDPGIVIADNVDVTLIGDPNTTYKRNKNGSVITIGMGGHVGIQNLDISCGTGTGIGIQTKVGTFTFSQLTIHGCVMGANGGIFVNGNGATLTLTRSKIYDNGSNGVTLMGMVHFDITNTFIVHNGAANVAAPAGGIALGMGTHTDRFAFNTVADNAVKPGMGIFGGVTCPMGFAARDNILAANLSGTTVSYTTANCDGGSLSAAMDTGFNFVNTTTTPYDYHVTIGSIAVDSDLTPDTGVTEDYDGDPRPVNGIYDYGADEL